MSELNHRSSTIHRQIQVHKDGQFVGIFDPRSPGVEKIADWCDPIAACSGHSEALYRLPGNLFVWVRDDPLDTPYGVDLEQTGEYLTPLEAAKWLHKHRLQLPDDLLGVLESCNLVVHQNDRMQWLTQPENGPPLQLTCNVSTENTNQLCDRLQLDELSKTVILRRGVNESDTYTIDNPAAFEMYSAIVKKQGSIVSTTELQSLPGCHDKRPSRLFREHLPPALRDTIRSKPGNNGGYWLQLAQSEQSCT